MYPYHYNDENNIQEEVLEAKQFQPPSREHKPYPPFPPGNKPEHKPFPPEHRPEHKPEHRPEHRPEPEHRPRTDYGKPRTGPPSYIPERGPSLYAVDPGAIYRCLYNHTYVWLTNGNSFWLYPVYVGPRSISGYRWSQFGWTYIGMDLDSIQSFSCGG